MGRYYSGDIEGKFWFALQASNCADRFGRTGQVPNYIEYSFWIDDLPEVQEEIQRIEDKLGIFKEKIDKFFEVNNGYNDHLLAQNGISKELLSVNNPFTFLPKPLLEFSKYSNSENKKTFPFFSLYFTLLIALIFFIFKS